MKEKAKILVLLPVIAAAVCLIFFAIKKNRPQTVRQNYQSKSCDRIVSLAPSTTEILFALGLGDKVAGVSQFCNWPPEAKKLPKMGGLMNPNYEAIIAAKPDLVIVFDDMPESENKFRTMGIETLAIKHDTISDILDAIGAIGRRCGKEQAAQSMVENISNKIHAIESRNQTQNRPKVLISIGHDYSQDAGAMPKNIYIAGNDGFYSEIIKLAGGQNAYTGSIPDPAVNFESIVSMNPQIIIDILPPANANTDGETVKKQWQNLSDIDAAKNDRIYVFSEDYMSIPGPRFINIIEKIAEAIGQPGSN